jgi:hypothetical protein
MRIHHTMFVLSVSLFLAAGWSFSLVEVHAADVKPAKVVVPVAPAAVASGAVEDTLQICLARIPQGATPGQRLMAEQSCHRDESGRASMQAVPGR